MSEKTAWEVARDAYFDVKQTKHCPSGSVMGRERISWQAAADAIAAPLLARIAALEEQLALVKPDGCLCQGCGTLYALDVIVPDDIWELIKPSGKPEGAGLLCPQCMSDRFVAHYDVLRAELKRPRMESVWAHERPCNYCGTPMYSSDPMQEGEVHGTCQAAYQRGVTEERERCAKVVDDEADEAEFKMLACASHDPKREHYESAMVVLEYAAKSIRSASPAVDVTSDKGGER